MSRRSALIALVSTILLVVSASPAVAAKDGRSGGPTLDVYELGSAAFNETGSGQSQDTLLVVGEGYKRGTAVFVTYGSGIPSTLVQADRNGTFTYSWTPPQAGVYTLRSYQYMNGKGWSFGASASVTVG